MTPSFSTPEAFHDALVDHGLIVPVGARGAFGRGPVFERVLERLNGLLSEASAGDACESYTFPPVLDRGVLERVRYMHTFPHLCGAVCSFEGDERGARELTGRIDRSEPWSDLLGMTDVVLNPAACYPLYPALAGRVPENGRRVSMLNWVYRHEPSADPTRLQSFRVREFVCAGAPGPVVAWRDEWLRRGLDVLGAVGLRAEACLASDAFFGRAGKVLAASQQEQRLKLEIVVPILPGREPTALCSFNYHQDHFGRLFDIHTPDGEVAHSACAGFGLERVVLALFGAHGFDPAGWPAAPRERLGL